MDKDTLTESVVREAYKKMGLAADREYERLMLSALTDGPPKSRTPVSSGITHNARFVDYYAQPRNARGEYVAYTKESNLATPAAETLTLYEVYVTDSRYADAQEGGIDVIHIRTKSEEDAKIKAILRLGYEEDELQYLDFVIMCRIASVKPIIVAAE